MALKVPATFLRKCLAGIICTTPVWVVGKTTLKRVGRNGLGLKKRTSWPWGGTDWLDIMGMQVVWKRVWFLWRHLLWIPWDLRRKKVLFWSTIGTQYRSNVRGTKASPGTERLCMGGKLRQVLRGLFSCRCKQISNTGLFLVAKSILSKTIFFSYNYLWICNWRTRIAWWPHTTLKM